MVNYDKIIEILNANMVLATGCTEPGAIALTAAAAAEKLGETVETLDVIASGNIIKNAYSAGIPGTGLTGIEYAAAIGAIVAKPEKQLEVINGISAEQLNTAKEMVAAKKVTLDLSKDPEKLYIEVIAKGNGHVATAIIAKAHTNLCYLEKDGEVLLDTRSPSAEGGSKGIDVREYLSVAKIHEFATTVDVETLDIIKQSVEVNSIIAGEGMKNDYGLMIGKSMEKEIKEGIRAYDCINYSMMIAAAAADARMAGADFSVVTNSGSGNQGMTASIPVIVYARELGVDEDKMYRALALSDLTTIHQKTPIGRLSAFCGAVSAGAGAGAGIAYLHGGDFDAVVHTVINAVAIVSGMVCDGAKASCAAKIAESVDAGIIGYNMHIRGQNFEDGDGIVKAGIEDTIQSVGRLAKDGMKVTNEEILSIMINK